MNYGSIQALPVASPNMRDAARSVLISADMGGVLSREDEGEWRFDSCNCLSVNLRM